MTSHLQATLTIDGLLTNCLDYKWSVTIGNEMISFYIRFVFRFDYFIQFLDVNWKLFVFFADLKHKSCQ